MTTFVQKYDDLFATQPNPPVKLGRQGIQVVFTKYTDFEKPWEWTIETQNGVTVARSEGMFVSRWAARRSVERLFAAKPSSERTEII